MTQNVGQEKGSLLAVALASGTSVKDAAEQAGISRRAVERYLARPAFRRLVTRLRFAVEANTGAMAFAVGPDATADRTGPRRNGVAGIF